MEGFLIDFVYMMIAIGSHSSANIFKFLHLLSHGVHTRTYRQYFVPFRHLQEEFEALAMEEMPDQVEFESP